MRPLEALLAGLLTLSAVSLFVPPPRRYRWVHLLPSSTVLLAAVQLFLEGYRWQMLPMYCFAAIVVLMTGFLKLVRPHQATSTSERRKWLRLSTGILSVLAVAVTAALPILFPLLRLPRPTGPFAVGTTILHFVDGNRPETFTDDPEDRRGLFARVWYPAEIPTDEKPVSYCENAHEVSRALTGSTPLPSFLFDHLALVKAHSYREAELAKGDQLFPIVIFSHAYWGSVSQCTALMEDLASHGYVTVSLGHPYETPYLIQADGHVRAFDPRNEEFRIRGSERQAAYAIQGQIT